MSTTIQQNNTHLQSVLDSVNALEPNSGAGVPDTVTVNISTDMAVVARVCYSKIINGKVTTIDETPHEYYVELTNVVVGSLIYVYLDVSSYDINYMGGIYNELLSQGYGRNFAYIIENLDGTGSFLMRYLYENPNNP